MIIIMIYTFFSEIGIPKVGVLYHRKWVLREIFLLWHERFDFILFYHTASAQRVGWLYIWRKLQWNILILSLHFPLSSAILTLYLKFQLMFNEDDSTIIYHVWAMLCYFTPVIGAIIADTFLGRFRCGSLYNVTWTFLGCIFYNLVWDWNISH